MLTLDEIAAEVSGCTACGLAKTRLKTVPGEGPADAKILFIGEAPGYHENQQGRPFVGPAGQFLGELLASIGLSRKDVFIANVVKCRPPGNRDPQPDEMAACSRFLDAQIAAIRPRVIVTLGRFSMSRYFPGETISRVHGVARKHGGLTYFAMYHPAAALHQPTLKQVLLADIQKLRPILAESERPDTPAEEPAKAAEVEPEQLSLF